MFDRFRTEFDVAAVDLDNVAGELARELLESAGIPSMLHGPDFDAAEFGSSAHALFRHVELLVPRGTRERARAVLVEAWGEDVVAKHDPRT